MDFQEFYQKWQDRDIQIGFHSIKGRICFYMNWFYVAASLIASGIVYYLLDHNMMDSLLADGLIACFMVIFLYLVLFGTKIMKKRRCRLYEEDKVFLKYKNV